jgi:hypothetical protein
MSYDTMQPKLGSILTVLHCVVCMTRRKTKIMFCVPIWTLRSLYKKHEFLVGRQKLCRTTKIEKLQFVSYDTNLVGRQKNCSVRQKNSVWLHKFCVSCKKALNGTTYMGTSVVTEHHLSCKHSFILASAKINPTPSTMFPKLSPLNRSPQRFFRSNLRPEALCPELRTRDRFYKTRFRLKFFWINLHPHIWYNFYTKKLQRM